MRYRSRSLSPLILAVIALRLCTSTLADEASTAKRFERAKASEPQLIAFLKGMPKGADLHSHVGGAVYAETRLDAAIKSDLFFDPATCDFVRRQTPGSVPAKDLLTNSALASKYLDAASMRGFRPAVDSGHDHFFDSFSHGSVPLNSVTTLTEVISRVKAQDDRDRTCAPHRSRSVDSVGG